MSATSYGDFITYNLCRDKIIKFCAYLIETNNNSVLSVENKQSSVLVSWESLCELQKNTPIILGNFGYSNTNIHIWKNDIFKPMQSDNKESKHILLIGVGYPNEIKKQWTTPNNNKNHLPI